MRFTPLFLLTSCLLASASTVWSQPAPAPVVDALRPVDMRTAELQPVEAFVGDSTVLSKSLFAVQYGLQQSANFEQLMQSSMHGDQYVRQAAGLYAMFPVSTYLPTASGYVPTIPPGTVFHIGGLPPITVPQQRAADPSRMMAESLPIRHDQRDLEGVSSSVPASNVPIVTPTAEDPVRVRFIVDEEYRRRTMQSLIWRSIDRPKAPDDQAARGASPSESK
jgi:hypothetical protein